MQFDPLVEAKAVEGIKAAFSGQDIKNWWMHALTQTPTMFLFVHSITIDLVNDEETVTETVIPRGIPEAALSPDMSLSSTSSPRTPQQMDSPKATHDVEVAMAEKARSSSTSSSKKKSESRYKSPLSPETSVGNTNNSGSVGSTGSRSEPPKPKDIPFDFHKFLEQMRHRSATPITRYFQRYKPMHLNCINIWLAILRDANHSLLTIPLLSLSSFLKEFDKKPWTVNEQIKIIHDFLDVSLITFIRADHSRSTK